MAKKKNAVRPPARKPAVKKAGTKKNSKKPADDPVVHNWQSMFVVAEHWRSDLDFFVTELNFFRNLIDRYLSQLIDEKHIARTRQLVTDLTHLEKDRLILDQSLVSHLSQLTNLIQNPFSQNSQLSIAQHGALEASILEFFKRFRSLKTEVFAVAEGAMESEKAKHLLAG